MAEAYLLSRMKDRLTSNRPSRVEAIEIAVGRIFTRVLQPSGELEYTGAGAANHARPHRPSVGSAAGGPARRGDSGPRPGGPLLRHDHESEQGRHPEPQAV